MMTRGSMLVLAMKSLKRKVTFAVVIIMNICCNVRNEEVNDGGAMKWRNDRALAIVEMRKEKGRGGSSEH